MQKSKKPPTLEHGVQGPRNLLRRFHEVLSPKLRALSQQRAESLALSRLPRSVRDHFTQKE